jgi:hypothetical protein
MKLYKLTNENGNTYGNTHWKEGTMHVAEKGKGSLCSKFWIHAYHNPQMAVLMNPVHAHFKNPILWEAEGVIGKSDGTKVGCKKLTTTKQIPLPKLSTTQKIEFGIRCAMKVCEDEKWKIWAKNWLKNIDRSYAYAAHAAHAAYATYAAYAAAYATDAAANGRHKIVPFYCIALHLKAEQK